MSKSGSHPLMKWRTLEKIDVAINMKGKISKRIEANLQETTKATVMPTTDVTMADITRANR